MRRSCTFSIRAYNFVSACLTWRKRAETGTEGTAVAYSLKGSAHLLQKEIDIEKEYLVMDRFDMVIVFRFQSIRDGY